MTSMLALHTSDPKVLRALADKIAHGIDECTALTGGELCEQCTTHVDVTILLRSIAEVIERKTSPGAFKF